MDRQRFEIFENLGTLDAKKMALKALLLQASFAFKHVDQDVDFTKAYEIVENTKSEAELDYFAEALISLSEDFMFVVQKFAKDLQNVFTKERHPVKGTPDWFFIFALDKKNGFSKDGKLPWDCKDDLKFFSLFTKNGENETKKVNAVLMGRKTWDSIPENRRPLKDRINLVLTTKPLPLGSGALPVRSFEHAEEFIANISPKIDNVFVIGGVDILKHYIPKCKGGFVVAYPIDFECDQKFDNLETLTNEFYGPVTVHGVQLSTKLISTEDWKIEGYPGVNPVVKGFFRQHKFD